MYSTKQSPVQASAIINFEITEKILYHPPF
jgi:hypothetical protein